VFKISSKQFFCTILICFLNKQALAITGEEISGKVSDWLTKKGINGTPVFSKNSYFKDCNNKIEIKKMFQNYKTIKVNCLDKNGFEMFMRVKILEKMEVNDKVNSTKASKNLFRKSVSKKKNKIFKIVKLKNSLEKNDIIELSDIEVVLVEKRHQTSFFSTKKELVGRKLKKNLKMGQILHPRHLFENFDINNGDIISIVSNVGNASVSVSGEAKDSGNFGDLIKVKNLKSGKIVKGYVKKNKIIKIFR
jgi:flagella basal body P-ring formation protein FlgA